MVLVGICFGLRDEALFSPKKEKKRGVTWNFGMSQPNRKWYLMYSTLSLFPLPTPLPPILSLPPPPLIIPL